MTAPRLLVTFALLAAGCQLLVNLDGLEDRHCGPDEKSCPQGCVPKTDPTTGCALLQCAPCAPPHAKAKCTVNGECSADGCLGTWRDCDHDPLTGCETDVAHDPRNCDTCGHMCDRPANGIAGCSNKQCVIGGCNPGWENCNGYDSDGCEHQIWTDRECLTCNLPCDEGKHCMQGVCEAPVDAGPSP